MNRRTLYTAIFIAAILGLFFVQYKYLEIGVNLATVQFKKKLADASYSIKSEIAQANKYTLLIGQSLIKDNAHFNLSLDSLDEASHYHLKHLITKKLAANGIDAAFSYTLVTKDSVYKLTSPDTFSTNKNLIKFPMELEGYLPELTNRDVILELQFNNINAYLLSQLNGLSIPSLIFIVIIIVIFIWFLRSIYWQKQVITTTNAFIDNLTHELKTPVFSINLATKLLEKDLDASKKPFIKIIKQQTSRLDKHIDKVLELGKLEFQKDIFELKKIDFQPHLLKICEDFKMLSKVNNITFSFDIINEKIPIKAEITHLENAISNVLDNAQKYSENPIIQLVAIKQKNKLLIKISDNGIGINNNDKHLIFKKYYRVSNGDLHKVKGYGLGLSYVKEVIKKHKAKVTLDSKIGVGTTICFYIPLTHEN